MKQKRRPPLALALLLPLLLLTGACSSADLSALGSAEFAPGMVAGDKMARRSFDEGRVATFSTVAEPVAEEGEAPAPGATGKRLIIYTADLRIKVPNLDSARTRFLALIDSLDGYLQKQENQTLTCRIPAAAFMKAVASTKEMGAVLHESMHASDVTREFLDLEIRLDNAEKSRDRLLQILEKADKVADLIEVEKELKRISEEIERLKGQLRYMNDQIAFSTLSVTFNGPATASQPRSRVYNRFGWINRIGVKNVLDRF